MTGSFNFLCAARSSDAEGLKDARDGLHRGWAKREFRQSAARVLGYVLSGAFVLSACSPTMNWREIRIKDTALVAMLPCKPDTGARTVPLGGRDVSLNMTGCDAGGATFAVAHATVDSASAAPVVLAQWRKAALANIAAVSSRDVPVNAAVLSPAGNQPGNSPSAAATAPMRITAQGQGKDGKPVVMHGVWFAKDAQVFHAMVFAERMSPALTEATELFFSGLKLQ